jgi:hypothetical protein
VKVMVIPEDPTLDQYILAPIVKQLFEDLGRSARVSVLSNPRLQGVSQALDKDVLHDIVRTNRMIDLFLVLVDRDADEKRHAVAQARSAEHPNKLFVCLAVEEVEVWMLALHRDTLDVPWKSIREERDPKERFAHPFLADRAPPLSPGNGRAWAMRTLGQKWRGILDVCPELQELKDVLTVWLASPR